MTPDRVPRIDTVGPRATIGNWELRLAGHLDPHWSQWFCSLTLSHESDGTTTLRGPVVDQAELHGLLTKVRDIGATLLSATLVATPGPAAPAATRV